MILSLTDCTNVQKLAGGTATQQQFTCTPSGTAGSKSGELRNYAAGVLLKNITVTVTDTSKPDLTAAVPDFYENVDAGQQEPFSVTVSNVGNKTSSSGMVKIYASMDATITTADTLVGSAPFTALAVGTNQSVGSLLTAPSTAGDYWFGACVEAVAEETNTGNNCSVGISQKVWATGTVSAVSPLTATLGQLTTFTVQGSGLADTMTFSLTDCTNIQKVAGGTATQQQFTCTPTGAAGSKPGELRNYVAGVLLNAFNITVTDPAEKSDLVVSITNPASITPDTFTKHSFTVQNTGKADAADVVLLVKTPADLMSLGNGSSKWKTEMVAFELTQGSADCPLSTTATNMAPCSYPPPYGAGPYYNDNIFRLGAVKAGQSVTVNVTTRYSGYDAGSELQVSTVVTTATSEASTANNSTAKSFIVQAKQLAQGCDYENLVWVSPHPQGVSQNNFRAFLNVPTATLPLQLFGFSNSGQQAMLEGNGFVWRGAYQDGSYLSSFFAMAKAPSGSRYVGVSTNGGIYWSDDRVTWIAASVPDFVSMYDIEYSKGRYVAVGNSGVILTSTDGINWQRATSNTSTSSQLLYVDFGNNEFVAGGQGILFRSTDGVTWSTVSNSVSGWTFGSVWNGSQYLLFDMLGTSHVIMPNMVSAVTSFAPRIDGQVKSGSWYAVYWQDSEYVALTGMGILTSKNGRDWITRNNSTSYPYSAQRLGDKVIIAGANGGLWTGACVVKSSN